MRIRLVVDLRKAEQLGLFPQATPWVQVKQFVRRDGSIVHAHQRKHRPGRGTATEHRPPGRGATPTQTAEDYPPAGFDYDALVMRGEYKPGRTSFADLERNLAPGGATPAERARGVELTQAFLRKRWPQIQHAKTVEAITAALDAFDEEVGGKLYEEEQERRRAAERELEAAVARSTAHRTATDPGRVSSEDEGRRWAAGGAHPEPVYHATLAGSAIMRTGLKSRAEVHRDTGSRSEALGAGPEHTVSTTPSEAGARKIAAVFAALAEASQNPDVVKWFDEHWMPLLSEKAREWAAKDLAYEDSKNDPVRSVRQRINLVSYYAGRDHPAVLVPAIMGNPKPQDLKDIGYIKAYAHVDAMVNDRKITAGPGAGHPADHELQEHTMRDQAEGRPAHSGARHAKHLHRAHIGWDTANKAEQGERRFTSNTLTATQFVPITDWRQELAP